LLGAVPGFEPPTASLSTTTALALAVFVAVPWFGIRRQEVKEFDATILGKLDQAIWESEYLIKQSSSMVFWYLVPIMLVANVTMILNSQTVWAVLLTMVVLPLAYFGGRWEVRKCHLPKKRELESLREILLQAEEQSVA
jgi:hypothetical protein